MESPTVISSPLRHHRLTEDCQPEKLTWTAVLRVFMRIQNINIWLSRCSLCWTLSLVPSLLQRAEGYRVTSRSHHKSPCWHKLSFNSISYSIKNQDNSMCLAWTTRHCYSLGNAKGLEVDKDEGRLLFGWCHILKTWPDNSLILFLTYKTWVENYSNLPLDLSLNE